MLRIIIFIIATLLLASASVESLAGVDVGGSGSKIKATSLLRGGAHRQLNKDKKHKNATPPPVVEEEEDDDDDFVANAAKAAEVLLDEEEEASTTAATTTTTAATNKHKNKKNNNKKQHDTTTTATAAAADVNTTTAVATTTTATPIEKEHEQPEEIAEEAKHTSKAKQQETEQPPPPSETNDEENEDNDAMEDDMLQELDEVIDELAALDKNNTNGDNTQEIEELEEEEFELIEEIMEEEGQLLDDDEFANEDDDNSNAVLLDDVVGKDLSMAEQLGEIKDTIEEIESEDDDGGLNQAEIKEEYIEGMKQGEEAILEQIVKETGGNSSLIEDKIEEIEELEKYVEEEDDDGAWEEGKKEVEEGFQIIENALEEELASELNNATAGGAEGDLILDPALTMDMNQYNNDTDGTTTNATVNDEMELVSPEVKEAHSEPSNMDDGPDRDKITQEEKAGDEDNDADLAPAEGSVEGGEDDDDETDPTGDESTTTAATTAAPETTAESTASSTTTTTTEAAEDELISTPAASEATTIVPAPSPPTSKPTIEYVEPNDDSLDPVANEENTETEAFEDGKQKPGAAGATGTNDESMEEWEEEVEEEVKKVGGWLSFVFMILMIYTAYQMSENPDGICASLCRLVITVIGCILKILLIPFKYIIGGGRPSGGHYMATPDYRDPYGSRQMELT